MPVIFDQENQYLPKSQVELGTEHSSPLISFLIKHEIVKDETQATYLLIICILIFTIVSIVIFLNVYTPSKSKPAVIIEFDTSMMVPPSGY